MLEPFKCWDETNATKSLKWYDAYNKTKHNKEENLADANLINAITAVAAVVILFRAQFGFEIDRDYQQHRNSYIESIFSVETNFEKYKYQFYVPKVELFSNGPSFTSKWNPINLFDGGKIIDGNIYKI